MWLLGAYGYNSPNHRLQSSSPTPSAGEIALDLFSTGILGIHAALYFGTHFNQILQRGRVCTLLLVVSVNLSVCFDGNCKVVVWR